LIFCYCSAEAFLVAGDLQLKLEAIDKRTKLEAIDKRINLEAIHKRNLGTILKEERQRWLRLFDRGEDVAGGNSVALGDADLFDRSGFG